MIHVFCNKKGSGKTKLLLNMANEKVLSSNGHIVYIDDNCRRMYELNPKVRFISTEQYNIQDSNTFIGFLCGIISEDYDIDNIYIDGMFNIISHDSEKTALFFLKLEKIILKNNLECFINVSCENNDIPEYIKKYMIELEAV